MQTAAAMPQIGFEVPSADVTTLAAVAQTAASRASCSPEPGVMTPGCR